MAPSRVSGWDVSVDTAVSNTAPPTLRTTRSSGSVHVSVCVCVCAAGCEGGVSGQGEDMTSVNTRRPPAMQFLLSLAAVAAFAASGASPAFSHQNDECL